MRILGAVQQCCGYLMQSSGRDAVGDEQSLPVLDAAALGVLEDEAGDDVSRRFVEEYLLMLPARAAVQRS